MRDWIGKCLGPLGWRYYALLAAAEARPARDGLELVGFMTTRTVLARTPRVATTKLIRRLKRDPSLVAFFGEYGLDVPTSVVKTVWVPQCPSKIARTGFSF